MKNIDKINQRLEKLREFVKILSTLKGVTASDLKDNVDKRSKAERHLQLSIEACIDVAQMIIADKKLTTPKTAGESIEILGKEGILDKTFADDFAKAAGFRNILIHDYVDIDYEQVADKINNRLGDFDVFARRVANYIRRENI